ncbi:MAG: hypothetical protein ACOCWY_05680, partial [Thermodesulfobacteriota bacterium]
DGMETSCIHKGIQKNNKGRIAARFTEADRLRLFPQPKIKIFFHTPTEFTVFPLLSKQGRPESRYGKLSI